MKRLSSSRGPSPRRLGALRRRSSLRCIRRARRVPATEAFDPLPILEAPPGGAWWIRGDRIPLAVLALVDDSGVEHDAEVVSVGGLTTWAIAVPDDAVPGTAFRVTGIRIDSFNDPDARATVVVSQGAPGEAGDLDLGVPRATLSRSTAFVSSSVYIPNPLGGLVTDGDGGELPPLLWAGEEGDVIQLTLELDVATPERVVVDAGFGDLNEPVELLANASPAVPTLSFRIEAEDSGKTFRVRLRSLATGDAGPERSIDVTVPQQEETRFRVSACGCAASGNALPTSPANVVLLALAGASLAVVPRSVRRRRTT